MSIETQRFLRLITPSVMVLLFWYFLGGFSGLWGGSLDWNASLNYSPILIVVGAVYYLTPLRHWANQRQHAQVATNIRTKLATIAGGDSQIEKIDQNKLMRIFYRILDMDESLKIQQNIVRFNGYIWTSCADLISISAIFAILSFGMWTLGFVDILVILLFIAISLIAVIGSIVTTKKHMDLGDEQIEVIGQFYSAELRKRIDEITN